MTRAEALRALIERVEAGETNTLTLDRLIIRAAGDREWDCRCAISGSLDAVARFEAPLRERGYTSTIIDGEEGDDYGWMAVLWPPGATGEIAGEAKTEPRARLLAVLRALAAEEGQP